MSLGFGEAVSRGTADVLRATIAGDVVAHPAHAGVRGGDRRLRALVDALTLGRRFAHVGEHLVGQGMSPGGTLVGRQDVRPIAGGLGLRVGER